MEELVKTLNAILSAVPIHKSFLTTFIVGDNERLQQIEANNEKINITFNDSKNLWGINILGFINTIVNILANDSLIFLYTEDGLLKEVLIKSKVDRGEIS
jgi:hypothetical protein